MIVDEVSERLRHNSLRQPGKSVNSHALALRVETLTRRLSIPTTWSTVEGTDQPSLDNGGCPIPPPILIGDEALVVMLNDAALMNGASDATSVWDLLDDIGRLYNHEKFPVIPPPASPKDGSNYDTLFKPSSVMVYTPLVPAADSQVKLADHGKPVQNTFTFGSAACSEPPPSSWSWTCLPRLLPTWLITPKTCYDPTQITKSSSPGWMPSKDKISLHCTWWGYRMFLPPPVLEILNSSELKMIQRATLITRALVWFFNNIPIYALPPTFHPILFLLQRLVPFLGYIGAFLAWSWTFIRSFDKGNGVILSATWVVPIALIPSTWGEHDWPTTPGQAK